jgi:DNA-binding NarL/FixJ family response regulator
MSRVYLVDDHDIVRVGLRSVLESGHHEVVGEAAEPDIALAGLLLLHPDLLLLDLHLEGHSGLELLSEVQRRKLAVRTLVLTISTEPRDVVEAMRLGAAGYVLKHASRLEMLRAIDVVLNGRRYLEPEVAALMAQADGAETDLLARLSPRERQIVAMVVKGQTSQHIGEQLRLSSKTVDTYRSRLMAKLGVCDVTALVRFAIRSGVINAGDI